MQQVWEKTRWCIRQVRLSVCKGADLRWRQDGLMAPLDSMHKGMHVPPLNVRSMGCNIWDAGNVPSGMITCSPQSCWWASPRSPSE